MADHVGMTPLRKGLPTQVSGEESGNIIVEIVEIIVHETDEPNLVAHLFDSDVNGGAERVDR